MKTTYDQDAKMCAAVLDLIKNSDHRVAVMALSWRLKVVRSDLYDVQLIELDPTTYEEKLRQKKFIDYCHAARDLLIRTGMLKVYIETIQNGGHPRDFKFIRVTSFGNAFLKLPSWCQRIAVCLLVIGQRTIARIKKYRWISGFGSVAMAAYQVVEDGKLTHAAFYLAAAFGVVVATVCGLLLDKE